MYYVRLLFKFRSFTAENKTLKSSLTITRIKSGLNTVLRWLILPQSSGSMWKIMSHWHPIIHLGESIRLLFKIHKQAQLHRADAISTDTLLERHTSNSEDTVKIEHIKSCRDMWIRFNWPRAGFNGDYKNIDRGTGVVARCISETSRTSLWLNQPPIQRMEFFHRDKTACAWSWPLTSIYCRGNRTFTFTFMCFCSWLSG